ncbi:hypothetical protein, partial [Sphingomonas oleivorans]|uniref:hypothetical protein n=1 Tax=Sphingomonas oleivorans TaxID=1735121 RepID=UPI001A9D5523
HHLLRMNTEPYESVISPLGNPECRSALNLCPSKRGNIRLKIWMVLPDCGFGHPPQHHELKAADVPLM